MSAHAQGPINSSPDVSVRARATGRRCRSYHQRPGHSRTGLGKSASAGCQGRPGGEHVIDEDDDGARRVGQHTHLGLPVAGVQANAEAAVLGVAGALLMSLLQRSLTWESFIESLMGATRTSAMIAFILAGSAFLSLAMGFTGGAGG